VPSLQRGRQSRPYGRIGNVDPGGKLMKFRPLHDRAIIRRIQGEEKTKGGIIIPDTAKEKPQEAQLDAHDSPNDVKLPWV
jgi:chaperonin GroES